LQWCFDKTAGTLYFWNGSAFAAYPVAVSELTISTGISPHTAGYQAIRMASPIAMCTTSNSIGSICAEPTWTYSPGFVDTNYTISCTCASVGTNVPVVEAVTKASNTLVVDIAALTAASASCAEVDCTAAHD